MAGQDGNHNFMVEFGMNETLLTLAIEARNYENAEEIILQKSHTSFLDEGCYHQTPLYMVLSGADDVRTRSPRTERNFHLAKLLIQHGARVNYRVPHTCFGSEYSNPGSTSLQLLVDLFNSVTGFSDDGSSSKWNSFENPVIGLPNDHINDKEALIEDIVELVIVLFAHSADADVRYKDRQTVLHRTTLRSDDTRLFKVLLDEGVNVNHRDIMANSVLLSLCKFRAFNPFATKDVFIDILLEQPDLEVNARDLENCTALFHCLYDGDLDIAGKLLCHGSDPCLKGRLDSECIENIIPAARTISSVSPLFAFLITTSIVINGQKVTASGSIAHLIDCGYFDYDEILEELHKFLEILCPQFSDLKSLGLRLLHLMFGGSRSSLRQTCARVAFQHSLHNNKLSDEVIPVLLEQMRLPKTLTFPFKIEYFREKLGAYLRLRQRSRILDPENLSDNEISDESDGEYW